MESPLPGFLPLSNIHDGVFGSDYNRLGSILSRTLRPKHLRTCLYCGPIFLESPGHRELNSLKVQGLGVEGLRIKV